MIGPCLNCKESGQVEISGLCPRCDEVMLMAAFNRLAPMTFFGMLIKGDLKMEAL